MRGFIAALAFMLLIAPQILFGSNRRVHQFPVPQDGIMFLGNVSVRVAQNGNVIIVVDQLTTKAPDGIPDWIFRFAPRKTQQQYQNTSFDLQEARVFAAHSRLAVISREGYVMVSLSLRKIHHDDSEFSIYGDRSTDSPQTIRISKGFGLLRETPKRLKDGSFAPIDIEQSVLSKDFRLQSEAGGSINCDSGGVGATSCSVNSGGSGCSVSCSGGYYACCLTPATCRCIRN